MTLLVSNHLDSPFSVVQWYEPLEVLTMGAFSMTSFHPEWCEWNINSTLTSSTLEWFWLGRQKNVWPSSLHPELWFDCLRKQLLRLEKIVEWKLCLICECPFWSGFSSTSSFTVTRNFSSTCPASSCVYSWFCYSWSEGQQLFWSS